MGNPDIIIHCAAETNIDFCEKTKKIVKKLIFNSIKKLLNISQVQINFYFIRLSIFRKNPTQKILKKPPKFLRNFKS